MAGQKYNKAYEAYQQAVYRDGRNPTFWCSIGVLYFQINQYRDALDAYSRAIRINPYISEVWFDLGSLYESCNNQISDAIDAYARAAELDPHNVPITQRLTLLRQAQATGSSVVPSSAPTPQDVHPTAYANPMIPQPAGLTGPPLMMGGPGSRPLFRSDSRGPHPNDLPLPLPPTQLPGRSSPGPFGGRPPPPVVLDDNQRPPTLAPMDVDRPPSLRDAGPYARDGPGRGPAAILLHQPIPQQQGPPSHHDAFPRRMHSTSASPPPHSARQQLPPFNERPPIGPGQTPHHSRSPRMYAREIAREPLSADREGWERERERRMGPAERDWERERGREFAPQQGFYAIPGGGRAQSPSAFSQHRTHSIDRRESPAELSPRNPGPAFSRLWETRQPQGPGQNGNGALPPPPPPLSQREQRGRSPASRSSMSEMERPTRRYDPTYDGREPMPRREYEREREQQGDPRFAAPSENDMRMRAQALPPPSAYHPGSGRPSESPRLAPVNVNMEPKPRGGAAAAAAARRGAKASPEGDAPPAEAPKKRRRVQKRAKEDTPQRETPGQFTLGAGPSQQPGYARKSGSGSQGSPEPASSTGSGSGSTNRSAQPSPTSSVHMPPSRVVDEDYDEGVADALLTMAHSPPSYRGGPSDPRNFAGPPPPSAPTRSPPSRMNSQQMSPHQMSPHQMSPHSKHLMRSPPSNKRPLSPGPEERGEPKRSRVGSMSRPSPPNSSSTRPSPIPFRQQPTSHSPEMGSRSPQYHAASPAPTGALPTMLPPHPHPRPNANAANHLPPLNTRSPPTHSPTGESMRDSRSESPAQRMQLAQQQQQQQQQPKREIVLHSAGSPQGAGPKGTPSPASSHGSHQSHQSNGSHRSILLS